MSRLLMHKIRAKELSFHGGIRAKDAETHRICRHCGRWIYVTELGQAIDFRYVTKRLIGVPAVEVVRERFRHVCK